MEDASIENNQLFLRLQKILCPQNLIGTLRLLKTLTCATYFQVCTEDPKLILIRARKIIGIIIIEWTTKSG